MDPVEQTFADVVRGMQHAVNSAQELLEHHYLQVLRRYFDPEGRPHTVDFRLNDDHVIRAPLIALIPHAGLELEELTLNFSIQVHQEQLGMMQEKSLGEAVPQHSSFNVSFAPRTESENQSQRQPSLVDVSMKFKAHQKPEGVSRILDEFTKRVLPSTSLSDPRTSAVAPPAPPESIA